MSAWENIKPTNNSVQAKSTRDVFNPLMTRESIPQFTIPSLTIQDNQRLFPAKKSVAWKSHQWHSQDEIFWDRKARRSYSDPLAKQGRGSYSQSTDDLPDPVTKAAMSLPHLPKVTTPYGFNTLGESPQMVNKESVFFQTRTSVPKSALFTRSSSFQDSWRSDVQEVCSGGPVKGTTIVFVPSSKHWYPQKNIKGPKYTDMFRRNSVGTSFVQNKDTPLNITWSETFVHQQCDSLPKLHDKLPSKSLFKSVVKRYFFKQKQLNPQSLKIISKNEL